MSSLLHGVVYEGATEYRNDFFPVSRRSTGLVLKKCKKSERRQEVVSLGDQKAIVLIFQQKRPRNNRLEALKGHFQG